MEASLTPLGGVLPIIPSIPRHVGVLPAARTPVVPPCAAGVLRLPGSF